MTDILKALHSKTRRNMLKILFQKEMHISGIARELNISVPVALKHVRILENCGLVTRERIGNSHILRVGEVNTTKLEGIWWMIDESFTVEVPSGTNIMDALKQVSGIEIKKTKKGSFINSVDGKEGYYIYEVDGKIPEKAVDRYNLENDVNVELKRLVPVIGKKIRIIVKKG
ncbi:MAG: winged helix-turn-helix domain-containing protein [Candidatus Altiarchaeota archaeon]|nr:winged helix-turn-helix domain-containing protein [Candidatus Altiarchaeota archaeon]